MTTLAVRRTLCPVCEGTRVRDFGNKLPKKRQELVCENCQGEGTVPVVTCRGCGRPAMEWMAEVCYCGRKACWEKLVEMVNPNVVVTVYPIRRLGPVPSEAIAHWRGEIFDGGAYSKMTEEEITKFRDQCEGIC